MDIKKKPSQYTDIVSRRLVFLKYIQKMLSTDEVACVCDKLDNHFDVHSYLEVFGIQDCTFSRDTIPICALPFFDWNFDTEEASYGMSAEGCMSWPGNDIPETGGSLVHLPRRAFIPNMDMSQLDIPYRIHFDGDGRVNITRLFTYQVRGIGKIRYKEVSVSVRDGDLDDFKFFDSTYWMLAIMIRTNRGIKWIRAVTLLAQCYDYYEAMRLDNARVQDTSLANVIGVMCINGRAVFNSLL